jgi:mRNA degradation ribonuclease J1/J2
MWQPAENNNMKLKNPFIDESALEGDDSPKKSEDEQLMEEAKQLLYEALDKCLQNPYADWSRIKLVIRDTLNEFIWKKTKRKPMILPIIMDV